MITGCESEAKDKSVLVDGRPVDLEIRKVPFYDQTGQLIGSVGIGHDVTAEREATKALIIERRRYAGIFHHIHNNILLLFLIHNFVLLQPLTYKCLSFH